MGQMIGEVRANTSEKLRSEPESRLPHLPVSWLANQLLLWEEVDINL